MLSRPTAFGSTQVCQLWIISSIPSLNFREKTRVMQNIQVQEMRSLSNDLKFRRFSESHNLWSWSIT